jgi:glycogen debranching enzyme
MKKSELKLINNDLELLRRADSNTYFDKTGRKAAILGYENGTFEFWAYPLKICRNFNLSFLLNSSTTPIEAGRVIRNISAAPERTILTYNYQSFTVREIIITPLNEPGSIILLDIDTVEPMKVVISFLPEMQPMWPAGLGGQSAFWSKENNAYILSESRKKFNAFIGSPQGSNLSYTPAHMFSDFPNQFVIEVTPENSKDDMFVIGLAGGIKDRNSIKEVYENLVNDPAKYYKECYEYYHEIRHHTMSVLTPDEKINLAYEWGKITFDNMMVDHPEYGLGMMAGLGCAGKSGRPGFGWFFGGDAFLNSLAMIGYGDFQLVKNSLKFVQQFQREDGKIAHEVSQSAGLIDWFKEYPYAYIHADTTCFYLIAMYEYLMASGDLEFIKESLDSITKAYSWCISTDENGDGLMDNTKAGLGAFEIPPFTKTRTDIYLASSFTYALFGLGIISKAIGMEDKEYIERYENARNKLNEIFWDKEKEFYAFAFNDNNELYNEITYLCSLPMIWKLLDQEKSLKSLEIINSSELQTDWGTRSISIKSKYFDPMNYNYGAVWPYISTFPALANYLYDNPLQAYSIMKGVMEHVFDNALGSVHEVFSGYTNRHLEESVAHQAFSTLGYMLPLLKGMLGLKTDALNKTVYFSPKIPPQWEYLEIHDYKAGNSKVSFILEKGLDVNEEESGRNEILGIDFKIDGKEDYKLFINLTFPFNTEIGSIKINNKGAKYKIEKTRKSVLVEILVEKIKTGMLIIQYLPTYEIIPFENTAEVGAVNQGLRIIREINENKKKTLLLEGMSGKKYLLEILRNELIKKVDGAQLSDSGIMIEFPEQEKPDFIKKEIIIFS